MDMDMALAPGVLLISFVLIYCSLKNTKDLRKGMNKQKIRGRQELTDQERFRSNTTIEMDGNAVGDKGGHVIYVVR